MLSSEYVIPFNSISGEDRAYSFVIHVCLCVKYLIIKKKNIIDVLQIYLKFSSSLRRIAFKIYI
jgi:hypothetical protein